jgi:hypothetical protein
MDPYEVRIYPEMGGEIKELLDKIKDKEFSCTCSLWRGKKKQVLDSFLGYPHDGGLADKDGNKWWVYYRCKVCGYDWSFWKITNRLKKEG